MKANADPLVGPYKGHLIREDHAGPGKIIVRAVDRFDERQPETAIVVRFPVDIDFDGPSGEELQERLTAAAKRARQWIDAHTPMYSIAIGYRWSSTRDNAPPQPQKPRSVKDWEDTLRAAGFWPDGHGVWVTEAWRLVDAIDQDLVTAISDGVRTRQLIERGEAAR